MDHKQIAALSIVAMSAFVSALQASDKPQAHSLKVPEPIAKLVQEGNYKAAQAALEKDGSGKNDLLMAWILLKQGQQDAAIKRLSHSWEGREPSPEEMRQALAVTSDGAPELTETLYADYSKTYPTACDSPEVKLLIVMVKARLRKFEEAKSLANSVIDSGYVGGGLRESLLTLSTSLQSGGQPAEAIEWMERLFKLFPEASLDPAFKMQMAHELNAAERPTEALAMIDQIETNNPDYAGENRHLLTLAKGIAYEALGERSQSLDYWKKLRDMGSEFPKAKAFASAADAKLRQFAEEDAADEKAREVAKVAEAAKPKASSSIGSRAILLAINVGVICVIIAWVALRRRAVINEKKM